MTDVGTAVTQLIDQRRMSPLQVRVVALCCLVAVLDGFDVQAAAFAAPALSAEWTLGRAQLGAVFSSGLAGMLIGMGFQGAISDTVGRRPVIIGSVFLFGFFSFLIAFSSGVTELLACRALAGIGMGAAIPNILTLTSEYSPSQVRTRMMVIMNTGFPVGGLVGGLLSISLVDHGGWRAIFYFGGAMPLLLGILLLFTLPESAIFCADKARRTGAPIWKEKAQRLMSRLAAPKEAAFTFAAQSAAPDGKASWAGLVSRDYLLPTITWWTVYFFGQILFYSMINWLPVLLFNNGMAMRLTLLSTTMLNLGSIVGGIGLAWVADRYQKIPLVSLIFLIGALLCVMIAFNLGSGAATVMPLVVFAGICFGGAQLLLNAYCTAFYPTRMRSSGIGAAAFFGRLGSVAGPATIGVAMAFGVAGSTAIALLAVPAIVAAGATGVIRRFDLGR